MSHDEIKGTPENKIIGFSWANTKGWRELIFAQ